MRITTARTTDYSNTPPLLTSRSTQLLGKLTLVQQELDACRAGKQLAPHVQVLHCHTDLDALPRHVLQQLSSKLRQDCDAVDKVGLITTFVVYILGINNYSFYQKLDIIIRDSMTFYGRFALFFHYSVITFSFNSRRNDFKLSFMVELSIFLLFLFRSKNYTLVTLLTWGVYITFKILK